jgi:hypothetical protein
MIPVRAAERYESRREDAWRASVADSVTALESRPQPFVSADRGDASVTLNAGSDVPVQRFATTLTANRTVTLGSGGNGSTFRVVRTGLGAFTLDVGGLKTIPNSTAAFVDVHHDGSAWRLTAYGTL